MYEVNMKKTSFFTPKKMKKIHKNDKNGSVIYKRNHFKNQLFIFRIDAIEKKVGKFIVKTFD